MSFTITRGLQAVSLIAIIGMTANFISEMVANNTAPPPVLVGTLSVTVIAVLYVAISYILYYDSSLPLLISTGLDSLLLIAVIVVACVVGKPLSYLQCPRLPSASGNAAAFMDSVGANMKMGKVDYFVWAGLNSTNCFLMKAIWGLSIALCILFAVSAVLQACLWKRLRGPGQHKEIV